MGDPTQTSRVLDLLRDLQVFSAGVLTASAPRKDRRARRRRVTGAVDVTVPCALTVVPYLIEYAQSGAITLGDWRISLDDLQPEVTDNGLTWRVSVVGQRGFRVDMPMHVSYISDDVRRLCRGEWVNVGPVEVRLPEGRFVPDVYEASEGVVNCVWHGGPRFRIDRLLLRAIEIEMESMLVGPESGQPKLSWVPGWAEPRLVWGE